MRKWVFMLFLFCSFSAMAQDMAAVFVAMPDEYAPQLEDAWRKDLVDLYRSKEEARLKNNMNGYAKLVKLTDDYLLLESTERTTIEMKLLPLVNNTFVICKVYTGSCRLVPAQGCGYDFRPLPGSHFLFGYGYVPIPAQSG